MKRPLLQVDVMTETLTMVCLYGWRNAHQILVVSKKVLLSFDFIFFLFCLLADGSSLAAIHLLLLIVARLRGRADSQPLDATAPPLFL